MFNSGAQLANATVEMSAKFRQHIVFPRDHTILLCIITYGNNPQEFLSADYTSKKLNDENCWMMICHFDAM